MYLTYSIVSYVLRVYRDRRLTGSEDINKDKTEAENEQGR